VPPSAFRFEPQKANATAFSAVASVVAGGGFEPPTFGLCDLTHLSVRVGLYLHPRGVLAIQSLRLPSKFRGLGSVLPYRSRDVGFTDFDESSSGTLLYRTPSLQSQMEACGVIRHSKESTVEPNELPDCSTPRIHHNNPAR
jgi:hypothetical protein